MRIVLPPDFDLSSIPCAVYYYEGYYRTWSEEDEEAPILPEFIVEGYDAVSEPGSLLGIAVPVMSGQEFGPVPEESVTLIFQPDGTGEESKFITACGDTEFEAGIDLFYEGEPDPVYIKINPEHLDFIKTVNIDVMPKEVLVEIVGKQRGVLIDPKLVIDILHTETAGDSSGFPLLDHEGNALVGVYFKPAVEPGEIIMFDHEGKYILDHEGLELAGFVFVDTGESFKVMGVEGGILQSPVEAEAGRSYYLHPDGTISETETGSVMKLLTGREDGRFNITIEE